jgi:DNA polymerase-3 subunit epsilon
MTTGSPAPDVSIRELTFAVLDVETTGLNPSAGHRVCEVACLRIERGEVSAEFESLVDPGRAISEGAARVNQITPEMLLGAPKFHEIAPALLQTLQGAVLVAHNAPFDLGFLASELEIAHLQLPSCPVVDTLTLARRLFHRPRNSLQAIAAALEIEHVPTHRAMGDVWTTALLLERIVDELDERWGIWDLRGLLDLQGGSIAYPEGRAFALPPAIAEALAGSGLVRMRYVNGQGVESERTIRPIRVDENNGLLYLIAFCYRAGEQRTFRMDRIAAMAPCEGGGNE